MVSKLTTVLVYREEESQIEGQQLTLILQIKVDFKLLHKETAKEEGRSHIIKSRACVCVCGGGG